MCCHPIAHDKKLKSLLNSYIVIFTAIAFSYNLLFAAVHFYFQCRAVEAARSIHTKLLTSVFGSTLRLVPCFSSPFIQLTPGSSWLDQTPTSRIIARCTQDMNIIDNSIAQSFYWTVNAVMGIATRLGIIVFFTPIFLLPGMIIAIIGNFIGNMYLRAQLSVKREKRSASCLFWNSLNLFIPFQQCSFALACSFQCRHSWTRYIFYIFQLPLLLTL